MRVRTVRYNRYGAAALVIVLAASAGVAVADDGQAARQSRRRAGDAADYFKKWVDEDVR